MGVSLWEGGRSCGGVGIGIGSKSNRMHVVEYLWWVEHVDVWRHMLGLGDVKNERCGVYICVKL